jgi:hypothetical protein
VKIRRPGTRAGKWQLDAWPSLEREAARELKGRYLLVPALWSGSVEHFYHFLLGYLLPIALWHEGTGGAAATVRDCGPMAPWLDLLQGHIDLEVIAPGLMLQRLVRGDQAATVLAPLDDPRSFDHEMLQRFREFGRAIAGPDAMAAPAPARITLVDRGASHPHFDTSAAEIPLSGSTRRSVPNMQDLAAALTAVGTVELTDLADLTPAQQILVSTQTSIFVAQHGAALANMVWMAPGSSVVEIQSPQAPSEAGIFEGLARACGLNYVVVHQESDHSPIDIATVIAAVTRLQSNSGSA